MLVHGDALGDGGVSEDDEAEAAGAARAAVPHDDGLGDLPKAAEVVAEAVLARLPRDAADEELPVVGDGGGGLHRSRLPSLSSPPCNQPTTDRRTSSARNARRYLSTFPRARGAGSPSWARRGDRGITRGAGEIRTRSGAIRRSGADRGRASVHEERAGGSGRLPVGPRRRWRGGIRQQSEDDAGQGEEEAAQRVS